MTHFRRAAPFLFAALLALPACDVEFASQDVLLRHDRVTDTTDLLLLYGGLVADDATKGGDAIERLLAGDREFIVAAWPLHFPIDAWTEDAREALAAADTRAVDRRLAAAWLEVEARVSLVDAGLFRDDDGRLSGWQHLRVRETTRVVELLNEMISWHVLAEVTASGLAPDDELDARTITLWIERASAGGAWFGIDGGRIAVDVPLSDRCGRRAVQQLVRGLIEEGDTVFARLLAAVVVDAETISLTQERLRVDLVAEDGPTFAWALENPAVEPSETLDDELADRAVPVRADVSAEELRARLP